MARRMAPGVSQQLALQVIRHLVGSGRWAAMLWTAAVLVSLGWFADSLFEWLADLGLWLKDEGVTDWWPLHRFVGVAVFPALLSMLAMKAKHARAQYRPRVQEDDSPSQVRGLILFLSALKPDEASELQAQISGGLDLDRFRSHFSAISWRMPIEAIAYHIPRLRQVMLISSAGGSRPQARLFKRLVALLFPAERMSVRDVAELDSRYGAGVDFSDVDRLAAATDDAFVVLRKGGLRTMDILIDVTGGQKTNSIAGAIVALAEGRQIQYVTRDYSVRVYDVTYEG